MTTIGVRYHSEDIHNIIKKPMSPTIKSPRYKSKRKFWTTEAVSPLKKYNGHQTFGLAHYEAPESKNFLKKGRQKVLPPTKAINKKEFKCTINCKSLPVPKRSFEVQKQTVKNFVKENIKKAVSLEPKVPIPRRVETPRGTAKDLAHLLQMIKIRQSEEYGQIPKYLHKRKKREEKRKKKQELEMQAVGEYSEKMGFGTKGSDENIYMVDKDTRQQILDGLKENWNELSKQFLKLPVMTDTWPKIKKKMWLEKEIEQLEKDIKLVESHPYIYLDGYAGSYGPKAADKPSRSKIDYKREETTVKGETEKETEERKSDIVEEMTEEKKEEDKELNILNY